MKIIKNHQIFICVVLVIILICLGYIKNNFEGSGYAKIISTTSNTSSEKKINSRVVMENDFRIGGKLILNLKYQDLIKSWGEPKEIKQVTVYFPATEEPYLSYILKYDSIDIEMYPVKKNTPITETESFRFDITGGNYDFYGAKIGTSLEEYLKSVDYKGVFSVEEILKNTASDTFPYEYKKLLVMLKEANYYKNYDKAVYEQVILNDMPYGAVMLFKNNKIARIVYGYPNAS